MDPLRRSGPHPKKKEKKNQRRLFSFFSWLFARHNNNTTSHLTLFFDRPAGHVFHKRIEPVLFCSLGHFWCPLDSICLSLFYALEEIAFVYHWQPSQPLPRWPLPNYHLSVLSVLDTTAFTADNKYKSVTRYTTFDVEVHRPRRRLSSLIRVLSVYVSIS